MCGSGRGRVCSNWANPAADWRVLAGGVAMGGWCTHCSSPIDDLHQLNEEWARSRQPATLQPHEGIRQQRGSRLDVGPSCSLALQSSLEVLLSKYLQSAKCWRLWLAVGLALAPAA